MTPGQLKSKLSLLLKQPWVSALHEECVASLQAALTEAGFTIAGPIPEAPLRKGETVSALWSGFEIFDTVTETPFRIMVHTGWLGTVTNPAFGVAQLAVATPSLAAMVDMPAEKRQLVRQEFWRAVLKLAELEATASMDEALTGLEAQASHVRSDAAAPAAFAQALASHLAP